MAKETSKDKEGPDDEYLAFASGNDETITDDPDPTPEPEALKDRTLSDLWAKYPVGIDPQFEIRVERRTPKFYMGMKTDGHLETIYQPIDETYILDKWGGGSYWVRVAGPRKDGAPGKVIYGGRFVNIHGIPKVDSSFSKGPLSMVKEDMPVMRPPVLGGSDGDTVVEMAKLMAKDKERADKERIDANARLIESHTTLIDRALEHSKPTEATGESLKLVKETLESSRDEIINAHKLIADKLEKQVTELRKNLEEEKEKRNGQSSNQPIAELANAFASMAAALAKNNAPNPADQEIQRDMHKTLIDTHAKELQSIRDAHRAELEAVRQQMTNQVNATREAYERQIETSRSQHVVEIQSLRELQLKEREGLIKEHEREREAMVKEQERELRSLKESHAMFVENLKLTSDSKIEVIRTSNDMLLKKAESDITRLQLELDTSKRRTDELQARVEPQDIRSKLGELREMKDLTEDFFGSKDEGGQSKSDKIIDKLVDRVFDSPLAEAVAQRIAPGESQQVQQGRRLPPQNIGSRPSTPQLYKPAAAAPEQPRFRAVPRRPRPQEPLRPITAELPKEERLNQAQQQTPSQEDKVALENLLVAAQDAVSSGEAPENFAQRILDQVDPEQLKLMLTIGPKAVFDGIMIAAKQTGKETLLTVGGQRFLKAVLEILNEGTPA